MVSAPFCGGVLLLPSISVSLPHIYLICTGDVASYPVSSGLSVSLIRPSTFSSSGDSVSSAFRSWASHALIAPVIELFRQVIGVGRGAFFPAIVSHSIAVLCIP